MKVKMKAPKGSCSVSVDGVEYIVSKGFVEVDAAHIADMVPHGFEVIVKEAKGARQQKPEVDADADAEVDADADADAEVDADADAGNKRVAE